MPRNARGKEEGAGGEPKGAPRWLVVVSLFANLVFAGAAAWSANRAASLDADRKQLENELLLEKSTPEVATFHVISEVATLKRMIDSKEPLPFAQKVNRYRFAQNQVFDRLSADFAAIARGRSAYATITFLAIANVAEPTAYGVTVEASDGGNVSLGDLEGGTAILIGTSYITSASQASGAPSHAYRMLRFERRAGGVKTVERAIPPPVNPTWAVQIGNIRGWARALPGDDASHLKGLIPNPD